MNSLEESIAAAMDCDSPELVPYLPYILQDFFEIGSSAESIVNIIKENTLKKIKVLDLGCGKGAVTLRIAEEIESECLGIDGIKEFIDYANTQKEKKKLENCIFEHGDIRKKITDKGKYDIIILGSIGPVFGNYYETMKILGPHLDENGIIILDDGYIDDGADYTHKIVGARSGMVSEIEKAGMYILKEYKQDDAGTSIQYEKELGYIEKRCVGLMRKYPEKKELFEAYIHNQKEEYKNLEKRITCSAILVKKGLRNGTVPS